MKKSEVEGKGKTQPRKNQARDSRSGKYVQVETMWLESESELAALTESSSTHRPVNPAETPPSLEAHSEKQTAKLPNDSSDADSDCEVVFDSGPIDTHADNSNV